MKKKIALAGGGVVSVVVVLALLAGGDIIDLPAWANLPGVDVPIVGDTDAIDCRLAQIGDTDRVMITIVDGDIDTHADYVHVWNAGELVDPDELVRVSDSVIESSSTEGIVEQFYSVSIEPVREGRVFCESIILDL